MRNQPLYRLVKNWQCSVWLCLLLLPASVALGDGWDVQQSQGNFVLRADFGMDSEAIQKIFGDMLVLQADVLKLLSLEEAHGTIELNLFRTRWGYQSHLRQRVPEGANRPALFVQGNDRGRVYVYRHRNFERDLRHEGTHAVLHAALPYVPLWLDEGLAEYFEVEAADRPSGNPHLGELKRRMIFGWRPDLARLEKLKDLSEMGADEYREAWAWAHFFLHGPMEARQVLSDYLDDIQKGNLAGRLSDRLFEKLPNASALLVSHLHQWR